MAAFTVDLFTGSKYALPNLTLDFAKQAKGHCKFKLLTDTTDAWTVVNTKLRSLEFKNLDQELYSYLPLKSQFFSQYFRLQVPSEIKDEGAETVLVNLKERWIIAKQKKTVVDICSYLHLVSLPLHQA